MMKFLFLLLWSALAVAQPYPAKPFFVSSLPGGQGLSSVSYIDWGLDSDGQ